MSIRRVGDKKRGLQMMRRTSLSLLSAAAGAALTLIAIQPRLVFDGASARAAAVISDSVSQMIAVRRNSQSNWRSLAMSIFADESRSLLK